MYILCLNDMRCNTEHNEPVARAETLAELARFVQSERVEPYTEESGSQFHEGVHDYRKFFRKGGPLEWYNPPTGQAWSYKEVVDVGTVEERVVSLLEAWTREILTIPAPVVPDNVEASPMLVQAWKDAL